MKAVVSLRIEDTPSHGALGSYGSLLGFVDLMSSTAKISLTTAFKIVQSHKYLVRLPFILVVCSWL